MSYDTREPSQKGTRELTRTSLLLSGMAVMVALIVGCASAPRDFSTFCEKLFDSAIEPHEANESEDTIYQRHQVSKDHFAYAVFSNNAYDTDNTDFITKIALPTGWIDFCEKNPNNDPCKVDRSSRGFEARTYLKFPAGGDAMGARPTEIVFAFRGTTSIADWLFGNFLLNQYVRANDYVHLQFAALNKQYAGIVDDVKSGEKVRLVATGHSLGGGLAEHVAHCFRDLNVHAVSFNTSPRNHKHHCTNREVQDSGPALFLARNPSSEEEQDTRTNRIVRIHQHHEILSPVRKQFSSPGYKDTTYYFLHGNFFSRHSITAIAMGLDKFSACPIELQKGRFSDLSLDALAVYKNTCKDVKADNPCISIERQQSIWMRPQKP